MKILLVEDNKTISKGLVYTLSQNGYEVTLCESCEAALAAAPFDFDLSVIDISLPDGNGFELYTQIKRMSDFPTVFLTACDDEDSVVKAFDLGADDYITKPYSMRELAARVKANLRRSAAVPVVKESEPENQDTIISGDLAINVERYEVSKNGQTIDITLREFELLKFLAMQPDKIFSREKLLENVWGYEYYGDVRTVDVTVRRLREKIEDDPSMPKYIITKRGVGYYFNK